MQGHKKYGRFKQSGRTWVYGEGGGRLPSAFVAFFFVGGELSVG